MLVGPSYTASITFLGDGKFKATMQWIGKFEFLGKNIPRENVVWCKSVAYWSYWNNHWEGYNEGLGTYERPSVSRWGRGGGWGHESDKEVLLPNSDTDSAAPSDPHESESASDESDRLDVCNI
jgi:hypothetical protein